MYWIYRFVMCLAAAAILALYQIDPQTATVAQVLSVLHSYSVLGVGGFFFVMATGAELALTSWGNPRVVRLSGTSCSGGAKLPAETVAAALGTGTTKK